MGDRYNHIKGLKASNGIEYLLNAGSRIFRNPIYIYGTDYKLIAHGALKTTFYDPLWHELMSIGMHSEKTIELYKNEGFLDALANTGTAVLLESDALRYKRILAKITCKGNITAAYAGIIASEKPFDEDDLTGFKLLCKKISRAFKDNPDLQAKAEAHWQAIIALLVGGKIQDKGLYAHEVAEIYRGLKNYLYIAVIRVLDPARIDSIRHFLKQSYPGCKYSDYGGDIIVIMSSATTRFHWKVSLRKLTELINAGALSVGVSSAFENLFNTHPHYLEALDMLNKNSHSHGIFVSHKNG